MSDNWLCNACWTLQFQAVLLDSPSTLLLLAVRLAAAVRHVLQPARHLSLWVGLLLEPDSARFSQQVEKRHLALASQPRPSRQFTTFEAHYNTTKQTPSLKSRHIASKPFSIDSTMLRRQQKEKPVPVDTFHSDEETAVEADAIDDNYVSKVSLIMHCLLLRQS